jgi:DNA polymerase-3 subunit alpha (Gram-positive type)
MHFVILDLETTGLSKNYESITEFSGLKAQLLPSGNLEVKEIYSTLINPKKPIPKFITKLTGISNEMVQEAPTFDTVAQEIQSFIGDAAIVAHNATFDCGFLDVHFQRAGLEMPKNPVLCTRRLSRQLFPELSSYSLDALCSHFEIEHINAHRAEQDVKVTFQLFDKIAKELLKKKQLNVLTKSL